MQRAIDRLDIAEAISRYFFALDSLEDAAALEACFTEDAVWTCYDHGQQTPALQFDSRSDLTQVLAFQATQLGGLVRHHLTGLVFDALDEERAETRAKVLVTIQRPGDPAPQVRNTATCEGSWRKTGTGWRLSGWVIRRGPAGGGDGQR
ncbi:MAG: nuclear transport factor 2 family protein [Myxococcota bacterium]